MKSSITASCDVTQPTYEDPDAPMEPKPSSPTPTLTSSDDVQQSVYEEPDSLLAPKPSSPTSTITSSNDVTQSPYEDVNPTVTDGSHSDVNVKPVPRPRSRIQPKSEHNNNNNTVDSSDTTSDTTDAESSQLNERPADFKTPRPVRPSSRPPLSKYMTSRKPTTAKTTFSRAGTPASSLHRLRKTFSNEATLCEKDRPAVPPRIWASSLTRSKSMPETSPTQTRPPPPCFTPPPPPSINTDSESMYSEIEHYLDVLPEDEDKITVTSDRPTFRSQSGISTSPSTDDKEDIIGMCRWLKRVSKSDCMAPSLYGLSIEEEISSFNERAMNVKKALRLYNLLMMKRSDCMKNIIKEFSAISESLDKMQKKTKTMDIAGGTTGAVGGVTAVLGIAFAPMTLGASLIATAVGAGMLASAGGMGAHTAKTNKKKVVNRMTVEKLVHDYKGNVVEPELCLGFILSGMNELRRHDIARIQRAGAQTDALKVAHLAQTVFNMNYDRRSSVPHTGGMASERLLLAFAKDIDLYFTEKEGQKLKKSINSKFSGRVRLLSENLQEELNQMIRLWEKFETQAARWTQISRYLITPPLLRYKSGLRWFVDTCRLLLFALIEAT
ncbi:hypothetical protein NQZ68_034095 [Dissostichus eleginoides]|nr:hypothetical protein NQZ68_034095 [Dissostichus eleginoides]